jgi:hypothetical protein
MSFGPRSQLVRARARASAHSQLNRWAPYFDRASIDEVGRFFFSPKGFYAKIEVGPQPCAAD